LLSPRGKTYLFDPDRTDRPVPAPIHTKSFNIWKTKFPRNGLFF
jgi:hypothetical protein